MKPLTLKEEVPPKWNFQERAVSFMAGKSTGILRLKVQDSVVESMVAYPGRAILYADPGLGKTRISIETYVALCNGEKVIVTCTKRNALNTWRREFLKWTDIDPEDIIIVRGTSAQRRKQWAKPAQVYITVAKGASTSSDSEMIDAHQFSLWIYDECQGMRSRKTQMFEHYAKYARRVPYVIFQSGTLISRGPENLWTYLHCLNHKTFSSYWKWVNTFCTVIDGPWGKEIIGPRNLEALHKVLASRMVRISADDPEVSKARPPLLRTAVEIDMTDEQASIMEQLVNELWLMTPGGELIATPSRMAMIMKLRQALVCPKILDPSYGYGSAIEDVLEQLDDDPHIVIFTPFKKAFPFIIEAMVNAGFPEPFQLMGGIDPDELRDVEEGFATDPARALICTIPFAESFELPSARQAFFVGYEWDQLLNEQAEMRLLRLITPHPVTSNYYVYRGSVDDDIRDVLNRKARLVKQTMKGFMNALEKFRDD